MKTTTWGSRQPALEGLSDLWSISVRPQLPPYLDRVAPEAELSRTGLVRWPRLPGQELPVNGYVLVTAKGPAVSTMREEGLEVRSPERWGWVALGTCVVEAETSPRAPSTKPQPQVLPEGLLPLGAES